MYVADGDIRQLLSELNFATENDRRPFDPDEQIQPASIDLRLDCVFWRSGRREQLISVTRGFWNYRLVAIGPSSSCAPMKVSS